MSHFNPRKGAIYITIASALFSIMSAAVKYSAESVSNEMIVFFRNAFGLVALTPWIWRLGWKGLVTSHIGLHLLRSLSGLAAMYCFFYAIGQLSLADAVLLNYTMPLVIPFIAYVWLHEAIPARMGWGVVLGFLGVVFVLKPGPAVFDPKALVGLAAGLLAAVAQVTVRRMTRSEPTVRIVFYFAFVSAVVSAVPMWKAWVTPDRHVWLALFAVGFLATIAQLFLTKAFRYAPAGQIGPFIYFAVIFAGFWDWVFWSRSPDVYSFLGAALVCLAGVITIRKTKEIPKACPPAGCAGGV